MSHPRAKRRAKNSKREGIDLNLFVLELSRKSRKSDQLPGVHGARLNRRLSDYGTQLRAQQVLCREYGVSPSWLRRCFEKASREKGVTGEILLLYLERRLDNIVYRMGFASTRAEARQLVSHGSLLVNEKRCDIPSYQVAVSDRVSIRERSQGQLRIKSALALAEQHRTQPDWLKMDQKNYQGTIESMPTRSDLPTYYNEQAVVELYSN